MIIVNVIHYFYYFNFFLLMGHYKYMALGISKLAQYFV